MSRMSRSERLRAPDVPDTDTVAIPHADADAFMRAMQRRYACKKFHTGTALTEDKISYILECGRLSPSSFGLEHWHFTAVTDRKAIAALGAACFGQEAVSSAALVVIILVRTESAYGPDSAFVRERAERFPGGHPVFRADYSGYWEFLEREGRVLSWARAQSYIACANMMTGAAAADIDSCAIEGYDETRVLETLRADPESWAVGIVTSFGRLDEEIRPKIRGSISELASRL
ncbi:MAG: nitroreductase family protein [Rectinemataceae bacterium]